MNQHRLIKKKLAMCACGLLPWYKHCEQWSVPVRHVTGWLISKGALQNGCLCVCVYARRKKSGKGGRQLVRACVEAVRAIFRVNKQLTPPAVHPSVQPPGGGAWRSPRLLVLISQGAQHVPQRKSVG